MSFLTEFDRITSGLPDDWTDLELDLRIHDEPRYIEAATLLVTCNAQPYSRHDWHWRIPVANKFGHAAAVPAVRSALRLLDNVGIKGDLVERGVRVGRVEVTHDWGRPESVTSRMRDIRAQ
ncbi:MAG: hypothetical protein WCI34_08325 [Actinomycetes bacterium]